MVGGVFIILSPDVAMHSPSVDQGSSNVAVAHAHLATLVSPPHKLPRRTAPIGHPAPQARL